MHIGTLVVNLDHFGWVGVVINNHSRVTDHCYAANLTRVKPAHMNVSTSAVREAQIEMGNIVNTWLKMGMCLNSDLFWLHAEHIEQNRDIMRRKVPDYIDIAAKQA